MGSWYILLILITKNRWDTYNSLHFGILLGCPSPTVTILDPPQISFLTPVLHLCIRAFLIYKNMLNHSFWAEICTLLQVQSIGQSHWWGILLPSHVPAKFFSKQGGAEGWLCFECMWSVLLSLLLWGFPVSTCCSRLCSIWWEGYFLADVRTENDSSTVQKQEQQYPAWVTWVDIILGHRYSEHCWELLSILWPRNYNNVRQIWRKHRTKAYESIEKIQLHIKTEHGSGVLVEI